MTTYVPRGQRRLRGFRHPRRRLRPWRGFGRFAKARLLVALVMVGFALVSYCGSRTYNPVTGEHQYIAMTPHQEIALGLQAAPQLIRQHGGLYPDEGAQRVVDEIGQKLLDSGSAGDAGWEFEFHLLDDRATVNAFALPGGQVFITAALYSRMQSRGQLAGVLGHEIGHVVARHGAQRIAKQKLTSGVTGAVLVASGGGGEAQIAQMLADLVNMRYGRQDELESDRLGVRLLVDADFDPRALIEVMHILENASGGSRGSDFFSTHPSPENRVDEILAAIDEELPDGVPAHFER